MIEGLLGVFKTIDVAGRDEEVHNYWLISWAKGESSLAEFCGGITQVLYS